MFGTLGIWEILGILLVIALLFGGKKLPELGKGLGEGIRNFKDSFKKEEKDEITTGNKEVNNNAKDN
jgi:sec-independent protein translocase protein TatA